MGATIQDKPRQVIPRWRPFREAVDLQETAAASASRGSVSDADDSSDLLEQKRLEWEQSKDLGHAADLLATAVVSGTLAPASEAIKFILDAGVSAGSGLRQVAAAASGA